jgi:hypothetical protein
MCSEIDVRTRDNPEAALGHQPTEHEMKIYAAYGNALNQLPIGSPWQPPSRGDQVQASAKVTWLGEDELHEIDPQKPADKPDALHFDSAEHRRFMRSLG